MTEDETIILSLKIKLEKLNDDLRQSQTRAAIAEGKEEQIR